MQGGNLAGTDIGAAIHAAGAHIDQQSRYAGPAQKIAHVAQLFALGVAGADDVGAGDRVSHG